MGGNELSLFEKTVTTKELADKFGTRPNVITENAKKCLPYKKIENGKPTYWSEEEITVLLDFMKTNNNRTDLDLSDRLIGTSTELTPALKIKKAMLLMQEGYEEELSILRAKNAEKQAIIDRITKAGGCFSVAQASKALKLPYGRNKLFEKLREMKILTKYNEPYQDQIDAKHFKVITKVCDDGNNHLVPLITGEGLVYLAKKFNTDIDTSIMPDVA